MKVGDVVKRTRTATMSASRDDSKSLAIIVGFDDDGDLRLRYANPREGWEYKEDVDYISAWKLIDESR